METSDENDDDAIEDVAKKEGSDDDDAEVDDGKDEAEDDTAKEVSLTMITLKIIQ